VNDETFLESRCFLSSTLIEVQLQSRFDPAFFYFDEINFFFGLSLGGSAAATGTLERILILR